MTAAPVSVVIPCYRCTATIDRAIASVAVQSRLPAEVIVVDDASGDGTREHLQALAAAHPPGWIRVLGLERNEGAASARNAGWAAATQRYVAFLDADDTWHPRKIELQYGFMEAHPEVALSGHGHTIVRADKPPEPVADTGVAWHLPRRPLLMSNRFVTPSVMLRRELQQRFRPGRRHMEDHLLWLEVQGAGRRVVRLSAPLAYVYKPMYGAGGLSAELWAMEKAELENYWILRRAGSLGPLATIALNAYSLLKFARRLVVSTTRRSLQALW